MKTFSLKTSLAVAVATLALGLSLPAAPGSPLSSSDSNLPHHGVKAARNGTNISARALIGRDARSRNNEDIGEVKNLVVDTSSGKVVFALIAHGGVLGIGEKIHAVPYNLLTVPQQGHATITVNTDKVTLDSSPIVREDDLTNLSDHGSEIYRHYDQDWNALISAVKSNEIRRLMTVDRIDGTDVTNAGRKVGTIEDVIISPRDNQSAALLDPDDSYAGTNRKFLVSFNQLQPGAKGDFTTSLTKSDFAGAKPARGRDWWAASTGYPYAWGADYAGMAYSMDHPATGNAPVRPTIADIRQALRDDPALRFAAARISFDQQNDTLVLHGSVASDHLKQKIDAKLNRVATGWNIDDQLTIRNASE